MLGQRPKELVGTVQERLAVLWCAEEVVDRAVVEGTEVNINI
jgi:hypothetical protein